MPNELISRAVRCPYCGETIEIQVDGSVPEQYYVEDCQVCCQPINFGVTVSAGRRVVVQANRDDE